MLQGGESPARTGVTRRAEVRACREGVGPLAYRGYITSHEPAGGWGRDAEEPAAIGRMVPCEYVVDCPDRAASCYPFGCGNAAPSQ